MSKTLLLPSEYEQTEGLSPCLLFLQYCILSFGELAQFSTFVDFTANLMDLIFQIVSLILTPSVPFLSLKDIVTWILHYYIKLLTKKNNHHHFPSLTPSNFFCELETSLLAMIVSSFPPLCTYFVIALAALPFFHFYNGHSTYSVYLHINYGSSFLLQPYLP